MAVTVRLWVWRQGYRREELDHKTWRDSYLIRVHDDVKRRMRQQVSVFNNHC